MKCFGKWFTENFSVNRVSNFCEGFSGQLQIISINFYFTAKQTPANDENVLRRNKRNPKFLQIQKLILKYNHLVQNFLHFDFQSHLQLSLRTFLLLIHNKNHIGQTKKKCFLISCKLC